MIKVSQLLNLSSVIRRWRGKVRTLETEGEFGKNVFESCWFAEFHSSEDQEEGVSQPLTLGLESRASVGSSEPSHLFNIFIELCKSLLYSEVEIQQ